MIIAVAVENGQVCAHFGHSPSFTFYDIEDGIIKVSMNMQSPGEGHGILPDFIASKGAKAVLVGGMGAPAQSACTAKGIQVVTGVKGNPDEAALAFAGGCLTSDGASCSHHGEDHGHNCSHHGQCGH